MRKKEISPSAPVWDSGQVRRIRHFEVILDHAEAWLTLYQTVVEQLEKMMPEIDELAGYYESDDWKKDFADDEAGLLPANLKRGVLSEDAVYDLLEKIEKIKSRSK